MERRGQPLSEALSSINWRRGLSRLFWVCWFTGWALALGIAIADAGPWRPVDRAVTETVGWFVAWSILALLAGRVLDWVLAGFRRQ